MKTVILAPHNGVMVGTVAGMPDIIDAQWDADRVITL